MIRSLSLIQPDDFHLHLRDGDFLPLTVAASAACFGRAIIMPNLASPIEKRTQLRAYRQRICQAIPAGQLFTPLMTLYLSDTLKPAELLDDAVTAVKFYPAGATTNAAAGSAEPRRIWPLLEHLQRHDLPLLLHGESIDPKVDIFDREAVFIAQTLEPMRRDFPALRIVLEHISTAEAVNYIRHGPADRLAATITVHHLLLNRNHLLSGGLRPDYYCMPLLKREQDRRALLAAATSGDPRFFLGTDSAPHSSDDKYRDCGCAGVFSAPTAMALCADLFEQAAALDKLEGFTSRHGAHFYRLPLNRAQLLLEKKPWQVPEHFSLADKRQLRPLASGQTLAWQASLKNTSFC